jgi:hypothetical protein
MADGGEDRVWMVSSPGEIPRLYWRRSDAAAAFGELAGGPMIREISIHGRRHPAGDIDRRPRCRDCAEPIELESPSNPEGWIHAEDASYWGDHTAEPL